MTYLKLKFAIPLLAIPLIYLPSLEKGNLSELQGTESLEISKIAVADSSQDPRFNAETIEIDLPARQVSTTKTEDLPENPALVLQAHSGVISGQCSDPFDQGGERIVVYAFKKGTFNPGLMAGNKTGVSGLFEGVVSHAEVQENESYRLTSLQDGEYELRFIRFDDIDGDGIAEPIGYLELELPASLDLLGLAVDSKANLSMDVTIIGASAF